MVVFEDERDEQRSIRSFKGVITSSFLFFPPPFSPLRRRGFSTFSIHPAGTSPVGFATP